jgi:hypothetical protein
VTPAIFKESSRARDEMAKGLTLIYQGKESELGLQSFDRADVYGKRRRLALGPDGEPCVRVSMLADGSLALKSGMTGQGYFLSDGTVLKQAELEAFTVDGKKLEKVPSTLSNPQQLSETADPTELLNLKITTIYSLKPDQIDSNLKTALDAGEIFKIQFTFRDSYEPGDAFIFANSEGIFMLVGNQAEYEWTSLETLASLPSQDDIDEDDLDFDML